MPTTPAAGASVYFKFTTRSFTTGAPTTLAGSPVLSIYKDNSTTQSTAGVTLTVDFDAVTGLNHVTVDTSADGTFYSNGGHFEGVITTGTVGGVSVVGEVVGSFDLAAAVTVPTTAQIATALWQDLIAGADFGTAGSIGALLKLNIDAAISSRSTYAGADTSGTTTLLARLTATRAGLLDNLDAAISTRSTYAGADTSGTTTLLARLTATRAGNLDFLDVAVSSRLSTAGYTAPSNASIASILATVNATLDVAVSTRSTYAGADTSGTTTLLARLTATRAGYLDNLSAGAVALASGVNLTTSQLLAAPRNISAIADGSITVNDALWSAVCGAAGKETVVSTTYTVMTPSTGTTLRVFTLDSATAPTSRT